jgi:hypothetical protein
MVRRAVVQRSLLPRNAGGTSSGFRGERVQRPARIAMRSPVDEARVTETWTYSGVRSQYVVPATLCRDLSVIVRPRIWRFVEAASLHA